MRFCHVTVLAVGDAWKFLEARRAETGEGAPLSGSGVRDRPSESLKLFSRGIVDERFGYVVGPAWGVHALLL